MSEGIRDEKVEAIRAARQALDERVAVAMGRRPNLDIDPAGWLRRQ